MAKRGPKPKPHALKVLKGTRPDRMPADLPAESGSMPVCPFPLEGEALAEWHRFAPVLHRARLLEEPHAPALAVYCTAYGIAREAIDEIKGRLTIQTDNGSEKSNPAASVALKSLDLMLKVLASFGCTPVDRSRLGVTGDASEGDALDAFMMVAKRG